MKIDSRYFVALAALAVGLVAFMLPNIDSSRDALHWDWGGNRKLAKRVADEILFRLGLGPEPAMPVKNKE